MLDGWQVAERLHREGIQVARCIVERLMREMGLAGAVRGRHVPEFPIPVLSSLQALALGRQLRPSHRSLQREQAGYRRRTPRPSPIQQHLGTDLEQR